MVIVIGSFFASTVEPCLLESLEMIVGGVWVFGQLILFSMLGSRTEPEVFSIFPHVLPLMVTGLCFRFAGIVLALTLAKPTQPVRPCCCPACQEANWSSIWPDVVFCFL